jgi:hypothetical protein
MVCQSLSEKVRTRISEKLTNPDPNSDSKNLRIRAVKDELLYRLDTNVKFISVFMAGVRIHFRGFIIMYTGYASFLLGGRIRN